MLFSWCPLEYVLSAVVKVPELYHNYATLQKDNVWKIVLNWWDLDIQRFPFPPIIMILQKCLRLIYFWIKLLWKKNADSNLWKKSIMKMWVKCFLIIRKYCNLWITAKKLKQQNAC